MEIESFGRRSHSSPAYRGFSWLGGIALAACSLAAHAQTLNLPKKTLVPNEPAAVRATMRFGAAVAVIGGRAIVGAPGTDGHGAVYVFDQSGGNWNQTQKLVAPDIAAGTFGEKIAFDNATILISDTQRKRVYYFEKTNGTGPYRATAIITGGAPYFGSSVAMNGCNALITSGASLETPPDVWAQTHFYNRCRTGKWEYAWVVLDGLYAGNKNGFSVALDQKWIFNGGPGGPGNSGSWTWLRYDTVNYLPSWHTRSYDSGQANERAGYSVDVNGTLSAIGKPGAANGAGEVELMHPAPDAPDQFWNRTLPFLSPTIDQGAWGGFGSVLKLTPNRLLVTAQPLTAGALKARIFVYRRVGASDVAFEGQLLATNTGSDPLSYFGASISVAGRTLLVGEPGAVTAPGQRGGGAYIYQLPP